MYRIRVTDGYRWPTARVSGREFTKSGGEFADGYVNEEIRNSPLLIVEHVPEEQPKPEPKPRRARKAVSDDGA